MSRIPFSITQAEFDELLRLNQPGAGVSMDLSGFRNGITVIETKSAQQLVTEWWQRVGDSCGVVWNTVKRDPANAPLGFTGEPK